jgi:hypothetical protein
MSNIMLDSQAAALIARLAYTEGRDAKISQIWPV